MRRLGDISITRIVEREEPAFTVSGLLPDATPETLAPHRHWLEPKALDPATGPLILPIQLRARTRHQILIDGCGARPRPAAGRCWHQTRACGSLSDGGSPAPEDIDFVMCTHLHGDHIAGTRDWLMAAGFRPL
jgi:hypothetical protein